MMASTHTYDVPSSAPTSGSRRLDTGGVEMALNPDEVDLMDTDAMQAKGESFKRFDAFEHFDAF